MKVIHARLILDELRRQGVTDVLGVPDNAAKALLDLLAVEPAIRLLTVTREGEAFAIASGLWVGGRTPVVLIQNTGLLETGDALRGTAMRMRAHTFVDAASYERALPSLLEGEGPICITVRVEPGTEPPLGRGAGEAAKYLRPSLAESARLLRRALAGPR